MTEGGDYFNEKCLTAVKCVGCKSYNNANYFFLIKMKRKPRKLIDQGFKYIKYIFRCLSLSGL